jgi:hypothetical protein
VQELILAKVGTPTDRLFRLCSALFCLMFLEPLRPVWPWNSFNLHLAATSIGTNVLKLAARQKWITATGPSTYPRVHHSSSREVACAVESLAVEDRCLSSLTTRLLPSCRRGAGFTFSGGRSALLSHQASTSSTVQTRVFGPINLPRGKPCFLIQRESVG